MTTWLELCYPVTKEIGPYLTRFRRPSFNAFSSWRGEAPFFCKAACKMFSALHRRTHSSFWIRMSSLMLFISWCSLFSDCLWNFQCISEWVVVWNKAHLCRLLKLTSQFGIESGQKDGNVNSIRLCQCFPYQVHYARSSWLFLTAKTGVTTFHSTLWERWDKLECHHLWDFQMMHHWTL